VSEQQTAQGGAIAGGRPVAAIILAAGRSTRMKSDLPKVMHELCGRPMLAYVLDACAAAEITQRYVVVGFGQERVREAFAGQPGLHFVEQAEQSGTAHAVMMCAPALKGFNGDIVVIAGDMPLVQAHTLRDLVGGHRATGSVASLATTVLADPTGYGRVVRDLSGEFDRIVEHRDCTPDQLSINEVNPSYYCFDAPTLFATLPQVKPTNAKRELYLTDVLGLLREAGKPVRVCASVPAADATGINSRADVAEVSRLMQQRIAARWMEAGVTVVSPENTWIESGCSIGAQTVIHPFSFIATGARIGSGCIIGPHAHVSGSAVIADGHRVGPGAVAAQDAAGSKPAAPRRNVQVVRRPPMQQGIGS
jgi:bifunctional UDP-N-acetylglucosamine pyrophosphorylase/glucosamine-1-phosphate N-acetyltransferase